MLPKLTLEQRGETDFFSGEPLRALSTLVYSENIDLQRSASLTFAEITERGTLPSSQLRHVYKDSNGVKWTVATVRAQKIYSTSFELG